MRRKKTATQPKKGQKRAKKGDQLHLISFHTLAQDLEKSKNEKIIPSYPEKVIFKFDKVHGTLLSLVTKPFAKEG